MLIRQDLKFHMAGPFDVFLYIHVPNTEIGFCLSLCHFKRIDQGHIIMTDAHALTASSGAWLDEQRIPHALRRLTGANHRTLLPCAAIFGGTFLVLCDTLARTLFAPHEIPVGVVTSLSGGPFFLYLLTRKGNLPLT